MRKLKLSRGGDLHSLLGTGRTSHSGCGTQQSGAGHSRDAAEWSEESAPFHPAYPREEAEQGYILSRVLSPEPVPVVLTGWRAGLARPTVSEGGLLDTWPGLGHSHSTGTRSGVKFKHSHRRGTAAISKESRDRLRRL